MIKDVAYPVFDWGKELVDLVPDLICVCREGRVAFINSGGARMLGAPQRLLVGRLFSEFVHPNFAELADPSIVADGAEPVQATMIRKNGAPLRAAITARRSRGGPQTILVHARDLTEFVRSADALRRSETKVRGIVGSVAEAIISTDEKGTIAAYNAAAETLFGYRLAELKDRKLSYLIPGCDLAPVGKRHEMVGLRREGGRFPIEITLAEHYHRGDRLVTAVLSDSRHRRSAEDKLTLAAAVFEATADGIVVCDKGWRVVAVNPAFATVTGLDGAEVLGTVPAFASEHLREAVEQDGRWRGEARVAGDDGEECILAVSAMTIGDAGDAASLYAMMLSPASVPMVAPPPVPVPVATPVPVPSPAVTPPPPENASHDLLTGLPSQMLFLDRLAQTLAAAPRTGQRVSVLFIDLDDFTAINDAHGRRNGDMILKGVAERLGTCLRPYDTVARFRGDVFVVVMPAIDAPHHIAIVAERMLKALARPFDLGNGASATVGASIGAALYPNDGPDVDTLLRCAESAMALAKDEGKGVFAFFDDTLRHDTEGRLAMWHALDRALEHGEFQLHYQPRVEIETGKVTAVEALLRWSNPELGRAGPRVFVHAIEDAGRMEAVGRWIVDTACRQQVAWTDAGLSDFKISINLSDRQLRQTGFVAAFRDSIRRSGADPARIEVEITEDMLVHDAESCVATLWQLRDLGVDIVLDDFGSGDASLNVLRRFPIQVVKIDPAFIVDVADDRGIEAMNAMVGMTHGLGQKVVAVGVETSMQLDIVRLAGCDEVQGFLFCRPLSAQDLGKRLEVCEG